MKPPPIPILVRVPLRAVLVYHRSGILPAEATTALARGLDGLGPLEREGIEEQWREHVERGGVG